MTTARHTFLAFATRILYCSSKLGRSPSLGILKRVMRSTGAILLASVGMIQWLVTVR